jgi:hypothetical protein
MAKNILINILMEFGGIFYGGHQSFCIPNITADNLKLLICQLKRVYLR